MFTAPGRGALLQALVGRSDRTVRMLRRSTKDADPLGESIIMNNKISKPFFLPSKWLQMFFLKSFLWPSDSERHSYIRQFHLFVPSHWPKAVRYGNRQDQLNAGRWVGIHRFFSTQRASQRAKWLVISWWFPSDQDDQGLWSGAKNTWWAQNRLRMVGSCGRIQGSRPLLDLEIGYLCSWSWLMKSAVWTMAFHGIPGSLALSTYFSLALWPLGS